MSAHPEQSNGGCRWTLTGHETPTGTPYNAIDGPRLNEFETIEVMPISEHDAAYTALYKAAENVVDCWFQEHAGRTERDVATEPHLKALYDLLCGGRSS